jgi:hypothetical protein
MCTSVFIIKLNLSKAYAICFLYKINIGLSRVFLIKLLIWLIW